MTAEKRYMLLFSLGPVQSFIAQARKTRDLWSGSLLLSALMQASMEGITSKLVFPSNPAIETNIPDLPNKYIAIFDDADEAVAAARQSEYNIRQFWKSICDDVWRTVLARSAGPTSVAHAIWERQTDPAHAFEIFWVVVADTVSAANNERHYSTWLAETQSAFDRRKRLRNFQQQEERGEKSTISGERSALHGKDGSRADVRAFWSQVARVISAKNISKDGTECLDAIDTVKRFAYDSHSLSQKLKRTRLGAGFPSTSSIAAAPFIEHLLIASEDPAFSSAISAWRKEARKLGETPVAIPFLSVQASYHKQGAEILTYDGDCLFPETFNEKRLEKEFDFGDDKKNERVNLAMKGPESLSKLLATTEALLPSISPPTPYYAMIQMDGDKMGKLINGVLSEDEHRAISQALSQFSRIAAPNIVEEAYPGRLIYAGGDDVFALVPLARDPLPLSPDQEKVQPCKTVLDLVDRLQQAYRKIVQEEVIDPAQSTEDDPVPARKKAVTASTGIAIAHHYTSLSYVRRISKEAEQLAKKHYGRNALVVTVLRHSGEQTRVGCHWHYPNLNDGRGQAIGDEEARPIPLFLFFYNLFKEDILSPKCVFHLLEEAPTLVGLDQEAQESEIGRVLRRQRNPAQETRFSDDDIRQKTMYLVALARAMNQEEYPLLKKGQHLSVELHDESRRHGLVEVLGWLLVMHFLTRKGQK